MPAFLENTLALENFLLKSSKSIFSFSPMRDLVCNLHHPVRTAFEICAHQDVRAAGQILPKRAGHFPLWRTKFPDPFHQLGGLSGQGGEPGNGDPQADHCQPHEWQQERRCCPAVERFRQRIRHDSCDILCILYWTEALISGQSAFVDLKISPNIGG